MLAQQRFGDRDAAFDERDRRFEQLRIPRRGLDAAGRARRPPARFADDREVVRQRAPRVGMLGFEVDCAPQCRDRILAAAARANTPCRARNARRPTWGAQPINPSSTAIAARQVAACTVRGPENQCGRRLARHYLEDLASLFGRGGRVGFQKAGGVAERHFETCHAARSWLASWPCGLDGYQKLPARALSNPAPAASAARGKSPKCALRTCL